MMEQRFQNLLKCNASAEDGAYSRCGVCFGSPFLIGDARFSVNIAKKLELKGSLLKEFWHHVDGSTTEVGPQVIQDDEQSEVGGSNQ